MIDRRKGLLLLASLGALAPAATARALATSDAQPLLWVVEARNAKVYVFGFGDAKDRSWLTPPIKQAFQESQEVWFETPRLGSVPTGAPPAGAPAARARPTSPPASLFDVLGPKLSERVLAAAMKYGVPRERLEHVRPWQAYFVINGAYVARASAAPAGAGPDDVLAGMAQGANKPTHSEYATFADALAHFTDMPDEEAGERLEFLLDFIEDDEAGRLSDRYDWIQGRANTRLIDRMRRKWPALYLDEQVNRNVAWARRIEGWLGSGGRVFVAIGLQHTLGPDSLPRKLDGLGLHPRLV